MRLPAWRDGGRGVIDIRMAQPGDEGLFDAVAEDVFDAEIAPALLQPVLADARHHLCVAVEDGRLIGFVSDVHYVHPDKRPELWINEVGVAPSRQQQGVGRALLACLFRHARWVVLRFGR